MTEKRIPMQAILGKTITDIRCMYGVHDGWLDTAENFIQLDNSFFISIPYGEAAGVFKTEVPDSATSIFSNLADIPVYHVNKERKSIAEVVETYNKQKQHIFNRVLKKLFGYQPPLKAYRPYKVEYQENKLKPIINRRITDYLWESDDAEKGIFELDNGFFISEQYMAPSGTGLAGLHYFDNIDKVKERRGEQINRYSVYAANQNDNS